MTDENWLIVFNPNARNGKNKKTATTVSSYLESHNIQHDLVETQSKEDALQSAADSKKNGYTAVISLGGDGTAHYIANGAIQANNTLGLLPAGSGNDFAGALGLDADIEKSLNVLVTGRRQRINVVKVTTSEGKHYSINMVDAGVGAKVALASETSLKWLSGPIKYNLISFKTIMRYKKIPTMIQIDDTNPREFNLTMIILGFGQTAGSGMHFLPDSRFHNEKMQGGIIFDSGRFKTLRALNKVWKAKHIEMTDIVEMFWAKKVSVESINESDIMWVESEGEVHGQTKATFEAVPNGLEVIVPTEYHITDRSNKVTYLNDS